MSPVLFLPVAAPLSLRLHDAMVAAVTLNLVTALVCPPRPSFLMKSRTSFF